MTAAGSADGIPPQSKTKKKGPLATASGPSLGRKRPRRAAVTRGATAPQQHTVQRTNSKGKTRVEPFSGHRWPSRNAEAEALAGQKPKRAQSLRPRLRSNLCQ